MTGSMNAAQYTKHRHASGIDGERKVAERTIYAALERGDLPLAPDGKIDVARADAEWSPQAVGRGASAGNEAAKNALAEKRAVDLQIAELARDAVLGKVIDREAALTLLRRFAAKVGEHIDSWPSKATDALAKKKLTTCEKCGHRVKPRSITIALEDVAHETRALIAADPLANAPRPRVKKAPK